MNPLGLDATRFRVAVAEGGEIAGFGQLLPHNDAISELRSLYVRKEHRHATFHFVTPARSCARVTTRTQVQTAAAARP